MNTGLAGAEPRGFTHVPAVEHHPARSEMRRLRPGAIDLDPAVGRIRHVQPEIERHLEVAAAWALCGQRQLDLESAGTRTKFSSSPSMT